MTRMMWAALAAAMVLAPARARAEGDEGGVRMQRRFSLALGLGWNDLTALGPTASWQVTPNLAVDAGLGLGILAWKGGVRARWNLLLSEWTPFLSAGLMRGGFDVPPIALTGGPEVMVKFEAVHHLQLTTGVDLVDDGGFTLMLISGYAVALNRPARVVSGVPNDAQRTALGMYGSGLVFGLRLGYAF